MSFDPRRPGLPAAPNSQRQQTNYAGLTYGPPTGLGAQQQQLTSGNTSLATSFNPLNNGAAQRPASTSSTTNNVGQGSSFVGSAYPSFSSSSGQVPTYSVNNSSNGSKFGGGMGFTQYPLRTAPTKRQASTSPQVDDADVSANAKRLRQFPASMAVPSLSMTPSKSLGQYPSAEISASSSLNPYIPAPAPFALHGVNMPLSVQNAYQQHVNLPSSSNQSSPLADNRTAAGVSNTTPWPIDPRLLGAGTDEMRTQKVKDHQAETTGTSDAQKDAPSTEISLAGLSPEKVAFIRSRFLLLHSGMTMADGNQDQSKEVLQEMIAQIKSAPHTQHVIINERNFVSLYVQSFQEPKPNLQKSRLELVPRLGNQHQLGLSRQHPRRFSLLEALFDQNDLMLHVASKLHIKDFISLFCTSKKFHLLVNSHYTTYMKALARTNAPIAMKVFPAAAYRHLCVRDPALRDHPHNATEPRWVPSLRWVLMLRYREDVVRDILLCLALEGLRVPAPTVGAVLRIWALLDYGWNGPRIALVHNRDFFPDSMLVLAIHFLIKLDMRFSDPVKGNGETALRRLMLAQRSLTVLQHVLRRKRLKSRFEMLQMMVCYDYEPTVPNTKNLPIMGVPAKEVGGLSKEGWGAGSEFLLRPDQLILRECVRRRIPVHRGFVDFMLWGFTDWTTMTDVKVPDLKEVTARAIKRYWA